MLTGHYTDSFDSKVRSRGASYHSIGRVNLLEAESDYAAATVRGSKTYLVFIQVVGHTVSFACGCPYASGGSFCKHMWATLLAAEGVRALREADMPGLQAAWEPVGSFQDDGSDDPYWDDDDYLADVDYQMLSGDKEAEEIERAIETLKLKQAELTRGFSEPPRISSKSSDQTHTPSSWQHPPAWKSSLSRLQVQSTRAKTVAKQPDDDKQVVFLLGASLHRYAPNGVGVKISYRVRKKDGEWGKVRSSNTGLSEEAMVGDDKDLLCEIIGRQILHDDKTSRYYTVPSPKNGMTIWPQDCDTLLPRLIATGRCFIGRDHTEPLKLDTGPPWRIDLRFIRNFDTYELTGEWRSRDHEHGLTHVRYKLPGYVSYAGTLYRCDTNAFAWHDLVRQGNIKVKESEVDLFLEELAALPSLPPIQFPEEWQVDDHYPDCQPRLKFSLSYDTVRGQVEFAYGSQLVEADQEGRTRLHATDRQLLHRDPVAEHERLRELRQSIDYSWPADLSHAFALPISKLEPLTTTLAPAGWEFLVEGEKLTSPKEFELSVSSGIDWFELDASVDFGTETIALPSLLQAIQQDKGFIRLAGGGMGLMPDTWRRRLQALQGLSKSETETGLRFTNAQGLLLSGYLDDLGEVQADTDFARLRERVRHFEGIELQDPPATFTGELREYQRFGFGWLSFLREFGLGGCLADDMGLGKTIQVLAILARTHLDKTKPAKHPSLLVLPKSLLYNWQQEAKRFTPRLKVLVHSGTDRDTPGAHFSDYHVVLTTYGLILRDIDTLRLLQFEYCVLDEAQAIKNAKTKTAKAIRQLRATHRLALSGTPVENHLNDLWSLMEFLNPGLLGKASAFKRLSDQSDLADEDKSLLSRALRPILLRRTKEHVAKDLPPKIEQTLYCELEGKERKAYDELRDFYRTSLLGKAKSGNFASMKIQILEALLRLRQAACHPGLLDPAKRSTGSAKFDVLLPAIEELVDAGHKALVFSQFTTLLGILQESLNKAKITYAYLDGKTRNRQDVVQRFQEDPSCSLFLISLKAGGVGLNLTAADYVYLLDPWWNPAVEQQAIDRTHRIGQTKQVIACRLIARDTVEEKVLDLQTRKRDLADAILSGNDSVLRNLKPDDLDALLS